MLDCFAKLSSIWEVEGHFLVVKKLSIYVLDILGLLEKLPEPLHPDSVTPHETLMLSFLSSLSAVPPATKLSRDRKSVV